MTTTELCARCGAPVHARAHPALRLCPRHTREHLANQPPFACTAADIDQGYEPSEERIQELLAALPRPAVADLARERERRRPPA